MMKAMLGATLGGVVAGGLVAGAAAFMVTAPASGPQAPVSQSATASPHAASTEAPVVQEPAAASNVVHCAPDHEAVLQRTIVNGREVAQVGCVPRTPAPASYATTSPAPVVYTPPPQVVTPQTVYVPQPVATAPAPDIVERPVVRTGTSRPRAERAVYQREEEVEPQRSWKKTALVIGGAAGAGAGIGALAGGKKGALIGAAVGGGSGAIYEAIKRK